MSNFNARVTMSPISIFGEGPPADQQERTQPRPCNQVNIGIANHTVLWQQLRNMSKFIARVTMSPMTICDEGQPADQHERAHPHPSNHDLSRLSSNCNTYTS